MLLGTRVSMRVGASVVLLSAVFGVLIGGAAGFIGGRFDTFLTVIVIDSFLAFPGFLLAIALVAFLGPGIDRLILALVVMGWVGFARLARGQVLKVKTLDFVEAARALGASRLRIFLLHVLPNIIPACLGTGQRRHGSRNSGRSVVEFSRFGYRTADSELGRHA